jgi:hypothetical protein
VPNPSLKTFDTALGEIPHYQRYPSMLPFVGAEYGSVHHPKLLVVGESFYFPEESTSHEDPVKWYSMDQSVLDKDNEIAWINCRELLECGWKSAGHRMYRELNACLAELNLQTEDRPVSHIAFTNAFMRPAKKGASMRHTYVHQDISVSLDVLTKVFSALRPDVVVFASMFAWRAVGVNFQDGLPGVEFKFVSHPADPRHWNKRSYQHGRTKFINILKIWSGTSPCA